VCDIRSGWLSSLLGPRASFQAEAALILRVARQVWRRSSAVCDMGERANVG